MKVRQNSVDKGMLSKNVFRMVISLALLVLCLVIGEVSGGRIATADDYQYAIWPFSGSVVFSQTYGPQTPNHHCGNVIDVSNTDAYAPFDCYCIDIRSQGSGNQVLFQSANPVHLADGSIQIVKISFAHDENISDCITWKNNHTLIPQGTKIYSPGNSGNSSGAHIHAMFGVTEDCGYETMYCGKTSSCNSIKDKPGYEWRLNHTMDWNQAFFLCKDAPFNSYESNFDFTTHNIIKKDMVTNFRNLIPGRQLNIVFDNGQVTGAQSGDYIEIGSQVSLTATPLSGYTFTGWTIISGNVITEDSSNPYTFTMPENDLTIEATFKIISNTVVKRWKNVSANTSGSSLSMSAMLEIDAATLFGLETPHPVTYPRVLVSTSQGLGNPYSKYYDTPQDEVTTINGGKRHRYTFSLNNVSELVNDAGQSLQLLPGTVYYYRWMAVINDNLYTSELYSFTARNPLVTWSDLCTNGGKYSGLFNGVVRWDKSLSMQEVGCFVSTNRDAVSGASRQNHNGCAFKNDTTIKMDSSVTTDAANGTWVFYKGPSFDTITSFASNTTYYYKFYAYTSDNAETFSEIMPYTPDGDTTNPQIVSASVDNITSTGYDVYITAMDNVGVTKIRIGTWNDNILIGDAVWQETTAVTNGSATFHVSISDFGNAQNVTYHTNVFAFDAVGNSSGAVRVDDPYVYGNLTSVWMTPQTNCTISAGDSITLSFGADQPVDWYRHVIDMNTSYDTCDLILSSSTGGSTTYTFNTPGYYKTYMGAGHASGDRFTDPIYVTVNPPVSSIRINENIQSLMRGESYQLTVTTDPAEYDQSKLVWTSSDEAMVSVSSSGLITAHHMSDSQVTITCKSTDGSVSDAIHLNVISNLDSRAKFFVDGVPASLTDDSGTYGIVALIRESGDALGCDVGISFANSFQSYDVEYVVEEGNMMLSNGTLFVNNHAGGKGVVAAYVYDKYDDGSRGPEMGRARIAVFADMSGGTFTLPAYLNMIEENAFEGVAAKKYVLPASLTTLSPNSLAGIPRGSWIFFNSDTVSPFNDFEVLGLSDDEARSEDYVWFDTGALTYMYYEGDGAYANYYCLVNQVEYHWSDWTTAIPAGGTEFESKTQYRSRSVSTRTVYSDWSAWISNGTTAIGATDLRDVTTVAHPAQTKTVYTYDHYKYYNTSKSAWYYTYVDNSSNSWSTQGRWENAESDTPYTQYKWASSDGYDGWRDSSNIPWFHQGTVQVTTVDAYTEYLYRTRTVSQVTDYGEWSDWSDTEISGTDSLNVETRTVYRTKVYY